MASELEPRFGFHPLVASWFAGLYGRPTAVQAGAWEAAARGEHLLAVAPTGSGKTLAAFLAAISDFASGRLDPARLSVLYVSPLKALNEDIRRNLETPIAELSALAAARGEAFPEIRVATRSGDTPEADRRRMLRSPPSVLCTTPESLSLLLGSPKARPLLAGLRLVVLDEIHALAGDKRGAILAAGVARLVELAGEFRRVALSATVAEPETVARWAGGLRLVREGGSFRYEPRALRVVAPPAEKRVELSVAWPAASFLPASAGAKRGGSEGAVPPGAADPEASRYAAIVPAIAERIRPGRTLVVFCDARRRAERLAFLLNERLGPGTAWAHHGSLAKEARLVIEERLKRGELSCVVATGSLELGIDVGNVDEVVLAGTPPAVAAALQRAGRSGHRPGLPSKATVFPFHGLELLLAAALSRSAALRELEPLVPESGPLDVLAQVLLALADEGERSVGELRALVGAMPPFERLSDASFDAVLEMLAGRYADSRLRELEPRLHLDRETGLVRAREGARFLLATSGGAIPDRGLYALKVKGSGARIGELDEEFVWERHPGDAFTLGTQSWRIVGIGPDAVEVVPLGRDADFIPFWRAESRYRSPLLAARCLELLDRLEERRGDEAAAEALLRGEYGLEEAAAAELLRFLAAQRAAQGGLPLPGGSRLLLESYAEPERRGGARTLVLHSLRGGAVNEPLALVLAAAWEEEGGLRLETSADDDAVLLLAPEAPGEEDAASRLLRLLRGLGDRRRVERLLRARLEGSGVFAAQFRENAGRALLVPRGAPGKRTPLWITRLRASRLYDAVKDRPDFPVVAETWRSCLGGLFDLDGLAELLASVASGGTEVLAFASRSPSPFARGAAWRETNEFLYRPDRLAGPSSLSDAAIEAALASSRLRPALDPALVEDFRRRLTRLVPGWGPADARDLAEWARERVFLEEAELGALLEAGEPEGGRAREEILAEALDPGRGGRLRPVRLGAGRAGAPGGEGGAGALVYAHAERAAALEREPEAFVEEWLRREGPVPAARVAALFGLSEARATALLRELVEAGKLVEDAFLRGSEETAFIDAENLERLLRLSRKAARPRVDARPAGDLFAFVAAWQGLGGAAGSPGPAASGPEEALAGVLDSLAGYPAPVALWESDLLPARLGRFAPALLDLALASTERLWFGCGKETAAFARAEDLELFLAAAGGRRGEAEPGRSGGAEGLPRAPEPFGPGEGPLDFWTIKRRLGLGTKGAVLALWHGVWEGRWTCEGFVALRAGLANGFGAELPDLEAARDDRAMGRRLPAALKERWRGGSPLPGRWFALELEGEEPDALDRESFDRDRVRALARRYGLLCRGLLERELPGLRFSALFPTMRRMELAGELLSGRFFEGVEGAQFLHPEALPLFLGLGGRGPGGSASGQGGGGGASAAAGSGRADDATAPSVDGSAVGLPASRGLWLSALDPASPCAFPFAERPAFAPARARGSRIYLEDGAVLASLSASGRRLELSPGLDPERLGRLAAALAAAKRDRGWAKLALDSLDGGPAARHPAAEALLAAGFERDRDRLTLW